MIDRATTGGTWLHQGGRVVAIVLLKNVYREKGREGSRLTDGQRGEKQNSYNGGIKE